MDMRYERIRYFRKVSNKTKRGLGYYEPWHPYGCYEQPREDRYKNVDRTTIRKPGPVSFGRGGASAWTYGSVG